MKKIVSVIIALMLLTGTALAASYVCADVKYPVVVNGESMTFTEAGGLPLNYNGRTLLPVRAMADALGVPIDWKDSRVVINTLDLETLKNACVMIYTGHDGKYYGQSSGVLIDYDEILTCWHVVNGDTIYAAIYDDSTATQPCTLADTDPSEDAAILTPTDKTVKPVPIGDSDTVKVGDKVYIVSSPKEKKNAVTTGVVTGTGTTNNVSVYVFTTTAQISGGSSGGACFNNKGELIGMAQSHSDDGLSCIIPINDIRSSLAR
jgi:S1-C subfamily serine protease